MNSNSVKEMFPDWGQMMPGTWSKYGQRLKYGEGHFVDIELHRELLDSAEYAGRYTLQIFDGDEMIFYSDVEGLQNENTINTFDKDNLELMVCGANIAGMLECQGKIHVCSDVELTEFLVKLYNDYAKLCDSYMSSNNHDIDDFATYAEKSLIEEFKNDIL